jgi:hypothetical protein
MVIGLNPTDARIFLIVCSCICDTNFVVIGGGGVFFKGRTF